MVLLEFEFDVIRIRSRWLFFFFQLLLFHSINFAVNYSIADSFWNSICTPLSSLKSPAFRPHVPE